MPRFVLLRHDCPPSFKASHWDFMLERDGALLSWSLAALPCSWAAALVLPGHATDAVDAVKLADHRIAYLNYEGPVANGRGEVWRCDGGDFRWVEVANQMVRVELSGATLQHGVSLQRVDGNRWRMEVQPR